MELKEKPTGKAVTEASRDSRECADSIARGIHGRGVILTEQGVTSERDHGPNTVWGQGDTPTKDVLALMKKEKYPFSANIEYGGEGGAATEVAKCPEMLQGRSRLMLL